VQNAAKMIELLVETRCFASVLQEKGGYEEVGRPEPGKREIEEDPRPKLEYRRRLEYRLVCHPERSRRMMRMNLEQKKVQSSKKMDDRRPDD